MELNTYFIDFLADIRPQTYHRNDLKRGHTTLRDRLMDDKQLSSIIVNTFLQGSYRRATAIRPRDGHRSDVDIIVVTKLSEEEYSPSQALDVFVPFLEKHYAGKYERQGRSFGINLSYVDLDLVVTSAPSETQIGIYQEDPVVADDEIEDAMVSGSNEQMAIKSSPWFRAIKEQVQWKIEPLRIPDLDAKVWQRTHPLEQIRWTWNKNATCNGHYINVVKALKWWRRITYVDPKYPKGYPLEHMFGVCCPDGISSVAEGIVLTLEEIRERWLLHAALKLVPALPDHGVPEHNVWKRVSGDDFQVFVEKVSAAAQVARAAFDSNDLYESVELWRQLLGDKFPPAPTSSNKSGFTARKGITNLDEGRFA